MPEDKLPPAGTLPVGPIDTKAVLKDLRRRSVKPRKNSIPHAEQVLLALDKGVRSGRPYWTRPVNIGYVYRLCLNLLRKDAMAIAGSVEGIELKANQRTAICSYIRLLRELQKDAQVPED